MAKPIILTVDDDPEVLRAVERDLRKHFAENYRVMRAESGTAALEILRTLQKRNDAVALLLVDQRMPQMTGVAFLAAAKEFFPKARRVLLTAYADTDAAIRAINEVQIQNYLLKPWDPPEQKLYPALDDLLADWQATVRPPLTAFACSVAAGPRNLFGSAIFSRAATSLTHFLTSPPNRPILKPSASPNRSEKTPTNCPGYFSRTAQISPNPLLPKSPRSSASVRRPNKIFTIS